MVKFLKNKIKNKLIEKNGVSVTLETTSSIVLIFIILIFIISIFGILYTEYKLNVFTTELIRTAELYGEVGYETNKRQEELEKSLSIKPKVIWNNEGKFNLNERIELTCSINYNIKIPFFNNMLELKKKASGVSEVYWK